MSLLSRFLLLCGLVFLCRTGLANEAIHFTQGERHISTAAVDEWLTPGKEIKNLPADDWQSVSLPDVSMQRTAHAASDRVQTTWYRFQIPANLAINPHELFFYLPRWQTVGNVAVYGDGRLLWRSSGDPVWNGFNQPLWVPLEPPQMSRPNEVVIRIDSLAGLGAGISSAWIGTESALAWRYQTRTAVQVYTLLVAGIAFLALGIFCFAVWWRRRSDMLYLLCGAASIFFVMRYLHYVTPLQSTLISSAWFGWMSVNAINWMAAIILIFNLRLCERRYRLFEGAMIASVILHSLATLPFWETATGTVALSRYVYIAVLLFTFPVCLLAVRAAWQRQFGAAMAMAIIALLAYPLGIHDLMMHSYAISVENVYLLPLSQIGFFLVFVYIMLGRYLSGIESLERSHETLTLRLRQREEELAQSYARLREVEQREVLSRERQRMMQDMHDGLGGTLVGMMRMMDRGMLETGRLKAALQDSIDELRLTIDSLHAVEADVGVLLADMRPRLQSRLDAAGLVLQWKIDGLPPMQWLTPSCAMHIMRILQEIVTNIIKHANAKQVVISTHADERHAFLVIEDDGDGFAGTSISPEGHGLGNVQHRARILGAKAFWQIRIEGGTQFILALPLQRELPLPMQQTA